MLTSDASECLRVHRNSSIAMKMATIKPQIRTTKIPPMFSIPRPGREHKQHKLLGRVGRPTTAMQRSLQQPEWSLGDGLSDPFIPGNDLIHHLRKKKKTRVVAVKQGKETKL